MNNSFVMYRLPHETTYTIMRQCDGEAEILPSYADLNGRTGFVFSPFMMSEKHPLLLIRPTRLKLARLMIVVSISRWLLAIVTLTKSIGSIKLISTNFIPNYVKEHFGRLYWREIVWKMLVKILPRN